MRFESRSIPFNVLLAVGCSLMATSCQADPGGIASAPDQNKPISTHAPTTKKLSATPATSTPTAALAAADVLPPVLVHKSASCGCCGAWVDHLRGAGFTVRVNETEDLNPSIFNFSGNGSFYLVGFCTGINRSDYHNRLIKIGH